MLIYNNLTHNIIDLNIIDVFSFIDLSTFYFPLAVDIYDTYNRKTTF